MSRELDLEFIEDIMLANDGRCMDDETDAKLLAKAVYTSLQEGRVLVAHLCDECGRTWTNGPLEGNSCPGFDCP